MNFSEEFQKALAYDGYIHENEETEKNDIDISYQKSKEIYNDILSQMYAEKIKSFYLVNVDELTESMNCPTKSISDENKTTAQTIITYEDVKLQFLLSFGKEYKLFLESLDFYFSLNNTITEAVDIVKIINRLHKYKINHFYYIEDEFETEEEISVTQKENEQDTNGYIPKQEETKCKYVDIEDVYKKYFTILDKRFSQTYELYKSPDDEDKAAAKKQFIAMLKGDCNENKAYAIYPFAVKLFTANDGKLKLAYKIFSYIVKTFTEEIIDFVQDDETKEIISMAQFYLAECYNYSFGCEFNFEKAALFYDKAIQNGSRIAIKPLKELIEMFEHQANEGDGYCQYNLAVCYKNGRGLKKSDSKAKEWFDKAASKGFIKLSKNII